MAGTAPCDADEVPEAEAAVRDLRTDMFMNYAQNELEEG